MQEMFLGEAIKKRRLELGLTQEQLCEGICEPITISRLENGKQTPSRNRINALLERLDIPADRYYALLSKHELDVDALQKEIISLNARFEKVTLDEKPQIRKLVLEAHKNLEAIIDDDDTLSRQFILRSRVVVGTDNGPYNLDEKRAILTEAIRMTVPRFELDDINRGLYTNDEIKIINQLALAYSKAQKSMDAIGIWSQLYRYIQKHFHNLPSTRARLSSVAYNYAKELEIIGQFQNAIEIAEEAQRACLDYGFYHSLPGLLVIQAGCYHSLGYDAKSRDFYFQAYYLMRVVGDNTNLQILIRNAQRDIGLIFEDQGQSL